MIPCQRFRERELVRGAAFEEELDELLGVQRVTAGALEQRLLRLGGENRSLEELRDQSRRLVVRKGRER